jgi:hypothetical protein
MNGEDSVAVATWLIVVQWCIEARECDLRLGAAPGELGVRNYVRYTWVPERCFMFHVDGKSQAMGCHGIGIVRGIVRGIEGN